MLTWKKRRRVVRRLVCIGVGMFLAGCLTIPALAGKTEKFIINMNAHIHNPTESRVKTDIEPNPKWAIRDIADEYQKMYPDVVINFVEVTVGTHPAVWLQARMMAKDAPEVFYLNYNTTFLHYGKGWFLDLSPYLELPNPYMEGNEKWSDMFDESILRQITAPDGDIYDLVADAVGVTFFYNKRIFATTGVTIPRTWTEFLDGQRKIKAAGYLPCAMSAGPAYSQAAWWLAIVRTQFLINHLKKWDKNSNGWVDVNEIVQIVKNGEFPNKEELTELWRLLKEWTPLWPKGFLADLDNRQLFVTEKAAVYFNGSWEMGPLDSMDLPFEYGTFHFPVVTKESSKLATGTPVKLYGPWGGSQWCVPGYYKDEKKIKRIIDWLMFLSLPKNIGYLATQTGGIVPAVKGAEVPPRYATFLEPMQTTMMTSFPLGITTEFTDKYYKTLQMYLGDKISLEECWPRVEKIYNESADKLLIENPEWAE